MATDTEQTEALEPDESLDTGFDGATDSDESEKPDPVAELRSELQAFRESMAGVNPAQITSELGRIRSLQAKIDRLESAPAPQRDTFAEEAIASLANAIVASPLVDDEAKSDIRSLLSRLGDAKTKSERERLKAELLSEMKPAVSPDETQYVSTEAASATARVFGYADALGLTEEETATILNGKWQVTQADGTLDGAVKRLKDFLKAHVENKGTATRVAERKQAAGSGSPPRNGANAGPPINNMDDAYTAYTANQITGKQLDEYRTKFGVSVY